MKSKRLKVILAAILVLVSALSINLCVLATETPPEQIPVTPEENTSELVIESLPSDFPEADTTPVAPPADTTPVAPPADTTPVAPPVDTTPVTPPADTTPIAPPADTTPVTPPTETTTQAPYRPTISSGSSFTIDLVLNNGLEGEEGDIAEIGVDRNGIVSVPEAPKREGFKFGGWYSDEALTQRWDFLTSIATRDTVLYAKWVSLQDAALFSINVSTNLGGVITVEPTKAAEGQIVTITVTPDKGNQLVENSLSVNGKFIDGNTFVMPANNVIVEAQFEPETAADDTSKGNIAKIIAIIAIVVVVIVVVVIVVILIKSKFTEDEEDDELFFFEASGTPKVTRRDEVSTNRHQNIVKSDNQESESVGDIDEEKIRKIHKTGNINLNE